MYHLGATIRVLQMRPNGGNSNLKAVAVATIEPGTSIRATSGRAMARCLIGILLGVLVTGCHALRSAPGPSQEDCLYEIARRVKKLPAKTYLSTLDGQKINLQEFFDRCARNWPNCALYDKFYYWKNTVKEIESISVSGRVRHKIRMYENPKSICYPEKISPGRTHGDVFEIYDADGIFMGLGVYMGEGLYFPLPYSGYTGKKLLSF